MDLLDCIRNGNFEKLCELLKYGVNVEIQNGRGWTPLHLAVVYERMDFIKELINNGANIQAKNKNGDTPLHVASLHGYAEIVRYLLKNGADMSSKNIQYEIPFKMKERRNKEKIQEIVREHVIKSVTRNMDFSENI